MCVETLGIAAKFATHAHAKTSNVSINSSQTVRRWAFSVALASGNVIHFSVSKSFFNDDPINFGGKVLRATTIAGVRTAMPRKSAQSVSGLGRSTCFTNVTEWNSIFAIAGRCGELTATKLPDVTSAFSLDFTMLESNTLLPLKCKAIVLGRLTVDPFAHHCVREARCHGRTHYVPPPKEQD